MPDHSYDDLTLDRFWDDLVDSRDADAQWVEPERAAVVRRLHGLAEAPVPSEARERVRQKLLLSHDSPTHDSEFLISAEELEFVVAPRPSAENHILTRLPAHPVMHYAALAALLLLVLGGIIGSSRLYDRLRGDEPAMIQAPGFGLDIATPSDVTENSLLEVTLPIDRIPTADRPSTPLIYWSVPPGTQDSWSASNDCCTDPRILYIVDGAYTVRADGPVRVIRAGGQPETVSAETELTLGPGDAIAPSAGVKLDLSNSGSTPVYLLTWTFFDPEIPSYLAERSGTWPQSWVVLDYVSESNYPPVSKGPVRFLLREVTLAPGATLAPPANSSVQLFLKPNVQSSSIGENSDHAIVNQGSTQTTIYVVTLQPATESVQEQTLLDAVLPKDQLQTPGRFNSIMGYYAVPPGSRDSWSGPTDNAPEPLVWHVLSGTYSVRAEQELQVARAGDNGSTTVVAAGSEITLGPGDALVRPARAVMELDNSGQEPVHLVVWTLGDINVQGPSLPPSWDSLPCYPGETSGTAPTGPTRLKLRLVTLEPGSTLSAPSGAYVQQVLDLTQEAPNLGQKSDFSLINQGSEPATLYVVSLEPAEPESGTTTEIDETLLDVVLNEDLTSANTRFISAMDYVAVSAGSHEVWSGTKEDAPEPLAWFVVSGTYTVRADREVQVARAGSNGVASPVKAGEEITLGPGDALARQSGVRMELTNPGSETAYLVIWIPNTHGTFNRSIPSSWSSQPHMVAGGSSTPPTGIARLQLRRVSVEPNDVIQAPPGAWQQQALGLSQDSPSIGQRSDYSLINQGSESATLYVVSLEPANPESAATPPPTT